MSKVSVAMPLYNDEDYIEETLESILNQSYKDFEIIIVDDCSTDNSISKIEKINDSRIKLYKNERNYGIAYTRNRAISLGTGDYVALMDDDDISPINRFEKEVAFLDKYTDIDVVGGHCRYIDKSGEIIKNKVWNVFLNPQYIKAHIMLGNTVANGSTMFRRQFIEKHKIVFKDNMYGTEDYFFWVQCSIYGKIANIDEVLLYWRSRHDNETNRVKTNYMEKRKQCIDFIHTYALENNGFKLDQNKLNIINKVFMEEGTIDSKEEMDELYLALKELAYQAVNMKLENANEVVTMCRKRFGEKVGKAFYLWEDLS